MKAPTRGILGIAVVLVLFSALWLWFSTKTSGLFVEHGPMENFQALCIAFGFVLFLWQLSAQPPPQRVLFSGLALFYATFLVVEFDTRELGWGAAATALNGPVRNAWLAALWVLLCVWAFRHRRALFQIVRQWLGSPAGLLLMASGAFWLAGGIVDKLKLLGASSQNLLAEELLETNAALLMLLAAVTTVRQFRKRAFNACTTPRGL